MKNRNRNIFLKITVVVLCIFQLQSAYAGQPNKRLSLNISQEGVNKIAVERDRIAKVIGNEEEYHIEGDSSSGVIFLSSKLMAGDMSPITIITEKGFTRDINLKIVKAKEPVSILIKKPIIRKKAKRVIKKENIKLVAIEAIKEVSRGDTRNYSFRRINIKTLTRARETRGHRGYTALVSAGFEISKISEYSNRYISILRYEYELKPFSMDLKEITKLFPKSLAVSERGNAILVARKQ